MLFLVVSACGEEGVSEAQQACFDYADAYADLCGRCDPGTRDTCYWGIVNAAGGDCSAITEIRDLDSFYNWCLPWLETVNCDNFNDEFVLDESCESQLLI